MFTQDDIHRAFCKMPEEQKLSLAYQCVHNNVDPEKLEQIVTNMLNFAVEPVKTVLKYWKMEK